MKHLSRKATLLVGIMMVLVSGLLLATTLFVNSDLARGMLLDRVNRNLTAAIAIHDHRVHLLGGSLTLEGVILCDPSGETLAGWDSLQIDWRWWALLGRTLRFDRIVLRHPFANVIIDKQGRVNLEQIVPPRQPRETEGQKRASTPPVNIVVDQLQVDNGALHFHHSARELDLHVTGIHLKAEADLMRRWVRGDLNMEKIILNRRGIQTAVSKLHLAANVKGDSISDLLLKMESEPLSATLTADLEQLATHPRGALAARLDVDLGKLQHLIGLDMQLSGKTKIQSNIEGDFNDPRVDFNGHYSGGRLAGIDVAGIDLTAGLIHRQLRIQELVAHLAGGRARLSGSADLTALFAHGFLKPMGDVEALTSQASLNLEGIHLNDIVRTSPHPLPVIDGELTAFAKGASLEHLDAQADIQVRAHPPGDHAEVCILPMAVTGAMHVKMANEVLTLSHLSVQSPGLKLGGSGQLETGSRKLSARFALDADELADALRPWGITTLHGEAHLRADIEGDLNQPSVDLQVDGGHLAAAAYHFGDLRLAATLNPDGLLKIPVLELKQKGAIVRGQGQIALLGPGFALHPHPDVDARISFHQVRIDDFVPDLKLQGPIDADLTLTGGLAAPDLRLSLQSDGLVFKQLRIGRVAAEAALQNGIAVLKRIEIENGRSSLQASGRVALFAAGSFHPLADPAVALRLRADPLLLETFHDQIAGAVTLTADVGGTLHKPVGSARIDGRMLRIGPQQISRVKGALRLAGARIHLDTFQIWFDKAPPVKGSGWYALDGNYQFRLAGEKLALSAIDAMAGQNLLTGELGFQISGQGRLDNPQLEGTLHLASVHLDNRPLEDWHLSWALQEQALRVKGHLNFDLEATYHLQSGTFLLNTHFENTNLKTYLAALGRGDLSGELSGSVSARGNRNDLKQIQATVDLSQVTIRFKDEKLISSRRVRIGFADQKLTVDDVHLDLLQEGRLSINGEGVLGGRVDMTAEGDIPLEVFNPLIPGIDDFAGRLTLSAHLDGRLPRPAVDLELTLHQASFSLPGLQQRLEKGNGRIVYSGDMLKIEALTAELGSGHIDISGQVAMQGMKPGQTDLRLTALGLPLEIADTMALKLDARLALTGTSQAALLQGEIILLEGTYYRDVKLNLIPDLERKRPATAPAGDGSANPLLRDVTLDVVVRHRTPLVVDNNLASMEIATDFQISGNLSQPVVSGRASITEGVITYSNRRFEITRGVVDFANPYRLEPYVDIAATAEVRQWSITLEVAGTPDALEFKLSSVPQEEDNDIISLLLFGRTSQEMIRGEKGASMSNEQLMAQLLASTFGEDIKRNADLDILELDTSQAEDSQAADRVKVTVGKNLSQRLTVKYAVETEGSETTRRAISEYKLLESLLVTGFQDNKGIYGGGLLFRIEFR